MRMRSGWLLPWFLVACSDGSEPRERLTSDAGNVELTLDAQSDDATSRVDAYVFEFDSTACDPGNGPALEFGNFCLDASPDAQPTMDVALDSCVGASCALEAAVDASLDAQIDAAPAGGPCAATMERDCSKSSFFASQPDSATCSFGLFDALEVRYRDCETCNRAGYLFGQDLVIMDCGGCSQVYAEGYPGLGIRQAAGSCRSSRLTANLAGTNAANCVDVYTRLSSSNDGNNNDGMDIRRVCRCDVKKKQCITCAGSTCDAPPTN